MIPRRRSALVGAYVCPRGVFTVECTRSGSDLSVSRRFEVSVQMDNPAEAADQLIRALRSAGIESADVSIALRGFGATHHVLQLPPARDDVLTPVVQREVRRLEPHLREGAVGWTSLPSLEQDDAGDGPRSVLSAAMPRGAVETLERRLTEAGYRLSHLTVVPAAVQRLFDEFDEGGGNAALAAPLPDGPFLGYMINRGIRLAVEPPLPPAVDHESAALAEEVELGLMFVRQQFRGVEIERIVIVGTKDSLADAQSAFADRLGLMAATLPVDSMSPAALVAMGAVLDSLAPQPLSLGGASRRRREARVTSAIESLSHAAVVVVSILALWVATQSVRERRAAFALDAARRQVERDAFGLSGVRSTVDQRRTYQEAVSALSLVSADRLELQRSLDAIAQSATPPVRLDSLQLGRTPDGWAGRVVGGANGATNARALEALHDLYRELPQRLTLDSLRLDRLSYDDAEGGEAGVRFQLSFGVRSGGRD